jgi:hypothetical protein
MGLVEMPSISPTICVEKPEYVPDGYVSVVNNTTDDKKVFIYEDNENNHFIVAGAKDLNKTHLEKLNEPFHDVGSNSTKLTEEQLNINGHPAVFQVMTVEFTGLKAQMFHVSWYCKNEKLNMFATGTMKLNEAQKMKKMVQSIKCH